MSNEQTETGQANVSKIWSRLLFRTKDVSKDSIGSEKEALETAVERQTENSRKGGTIWQAVLKADQSAMERLLKNDPNIVDSRGAVGECPIHMLFLYGSETHLEMARYIITNYPHTITQIYNGAVDDFDIDFLI